MKKMKNATIALSMAQANAVAVAENVKLPKKDSGWVKVGDVRITRLPLAFRKAKRHAQAYRVTAPRHELLSKYLTVIGDIGRPVCIVWQDEE